MTDEQAVKEIRTCLSAVRQTPNQYGVVYVTISGGEVKFVDVRLSPFERTKRETGISED